MLGIAIEAERYLGTPRRSTEFRRSLELFNDLFERAGCGSLWRGRCEQHDTDFAVAEIHHGRGLEH